MQDRLVLTTGESHRTPEPQQRLFAAILAQALNDATALPSYWITAHENRERRTARIFLTQNSAWFRHVCEYAGIDSDSLLKHSQRLAAKGWPRPLDLPTELH